MYAAGPRSAFSPVQKVADSTPPAYASRRPCVSLVENNSTAGRPPQKTPHVTLTAPPASARRATDRRRSPTHMRRAAIGHKPPVPPLRPPRPDNKKPPLPSHRPLLLLPSSDPPEEERAYPGRHAASPVHTTRSPALLCCMRRCQQQ
ncbi:hypothetical protein PVAP13_5NG228500 [Panicum virgatum]|uniref:Uncharacterized protein n=1 Tax=Panicum virgatum TaxID=38727 RepID=A0A8T0RQM7_PANVG|nr:hypothetical protein PVAP13_5NG228500 [Panicum virgatum]